MKEKIEMLVFVYQKQGHWKETNNIKPRALEIQKEVLGNRVLQ